MCFNLARQPGPDQHGAGAWKLRKVDSNHLVFRWDVIKDTRIFVRDFDSTNGTRINDRPVKGEQELYDQDKLMVGPLTFRVARTSGSGAFALALSLP